MKDKFERILKRGVTEVIAEDEVRRMLEKGKPLRLKEGFDPSRADIHLGHVVGLRKLREFQELGHQVILIVGDWTAQIGDPSGQSQIRTMLSAEEVKANAYTYMDQFFKVVDKEKTEVRWQSDWFGNFSLADVISLTSKFTVAQMLAREDFSKRYAANHPIGITELLYPLLQAYDSVMIESDIEFGGIDQKFNCLMGRELQEMMGQKPQQVFFTPLLVGLDGKMKMSKSLDNYIGVDEPPNEMFGKVMSLTDDLIIDYFTLLTDVPDRELAEFQHQMETDSVNPMELKKRLGHEIVTYFHDSQSAQKASEYFQKTVQKKELPSDMPTVSINQLKEFHRKAQESSKSECDSETFEQSFLIEGREVLSSNPTDYLISIPIVLNEQGMVASNSEAKRLIKQSSIQIIHQNGNKHTVSEERDNIQIGDVIKVGKRRFLRIVE